LIWRNTGTGIRPHKFARRSALQGGKGTLVRTLGLLRLILTALIAVGLLFFPGGAAHAVPCHDAAMHQAAVHAMTAPGGAAAEAMRHDPSIAHHCMAEQDACCNGTFSAAVPLIASTEFALRTREATVLGAGLDRFVAGLEIPPPLGPPRLSDPSASEPAA
jgi:hypothetical protein